MARYLAARVVARVLLGAHYGSLRDLAPFLRRRRVDW